jgi:polyphosphate kinase
MSTVQPPPQVEIDFKQPEFYINQELSLLEFNARVLAQAEDRQFPLLERLKFLCIASTNLDEFFEIRVAGLKQYLALGSVQAGPDNMTPLETLKEIRRRTLELVEIQYQVLSEQLIPELHENGIRVIRRQDLNPSQENWLLSYFEDSLLPVLSPLGLDPGHPFPRILNKSLNFLVSLIGKDAFGRQGGLAVVQAPRALPRIIQLPPGESESGPYDFVFLSSVIHAYVEKLFPGMHATGCYQFRVTRNSDLFVHEEEIDDLLRALEGELLSRRYGEAVRLEVAHDCPVDLVEYLRQHFHLKRDDIFPVRGPVNLNRLNAIVDMVDRPDLKFPAFTPAFPKKLSPNSDLFEVLRETDLLVHHPFESFVPVVELVRRAATDPEVLAIKQTLYRTGPDSAVVDALVDAARAGKEVTVVIELRARFDEQANIELANRLQSAGAHVVYGIVGYKTHAKLLLIVHREGRKLRKYVHMGTGNYHSRTARLYTDYGLFTSDPDIGEDVHNLFLQLTSLGKVRDLKRLIHSPFAMHEWLIKSIRKEAKNARKGLPARIIFKVNSLVEPLLIQELYRASGQGVQIELVVRGMCRLRPGIPQVSEHISVRSIVGRFLEHTRVYYFQNGDKPSVYCSSADLRERNLFRRVEVAFPVTQGSLRKRVIRDLMTYIEDNYQAWELRSDGSYHRPQLPPGSEQKSAQQILLERLAEST